jgi:hypothetical protein
MNDTAPEAHGDVFQVDSEPGPEPGLRREPGQEPEEDTGDDPAAPAPLGVPRTPTGNADADAALERLADVDHLATDGHLEVYEDVHGVLRDALTALDTRPGPPAPGSPGSPRVSSARPAPPTTQNTRQ